MNTKLNSVVAIGLICWVYCSAFSQAAEYRTQELGANHDHGNLIAIEPDFGPGDYRSADALARSLENILIQAQSQHWLSKKSIVVFPEYTGFWLILADEQNSVYQQSNLQAAMVRALSAHFFDVFKNLLRAPSGDRIRGAMMLAKADAMVREYDQIFGGLARKFGVTIVAGSIVLPDPVIRAGHVEKGPGSNLYNVTAVFNPEGLAAPQVAQKIFPPDEEQSFLTKGAIEDLPVFDTPAGKLGVLVCSDSWFPQAYVQLKRKGVELVAVPAYVDVDQGWKKAWGGYQGFPNPPDVILSDIKKITEGDAWRKYAMPGRIALSGAKYGVTTFLRGHFWEMGSDGEPLVVRDGQPLSTTGSSQSGSMTSVWIE